MGGGRSTPRGSGGAASAARRPGEAFPATGRARSFRTSPRQAPSAEGDPHRGWCTLTVSTFGSLLDACGPALVERPEERVALVPAPGPAASRASWTSPRSRSADRALVDPARFPNTVMNRAARRKAPSGTASKLTTCVAGGWLTRLRSILGYAGRHNTGADTASRCCAGSPSADGAPGGGAADGVRAHPARRGRRGLAPSNPPTPPRGRCRTRSRPGCGRGSRVPPARREPPTP